MQEVLQQHQSAQSNIQEVTVRRAIAYMAVVVVVDQQDQRAVVKMVAVQRQEPAPEEVVDQMVDHRQQAPLVGLPAAMAATVQEVPVAEQVVYQVVQGATAQLVVEVVEVMTVRAVLLGVVAAVATRRGVRMAHVAAAVVLVGRTMARVPAVLLVHTEAVEVVVPEPHIHLVPAERAVRVSSSSSMRPVACVLRIRAARTPTVSVIAVTPATDKRGVVLCVQNSLPALLMQLLRPSRKVKVQPSAGLRRDLRQLFI